MSCERNVLKSPPMFTNTSRKRSSQVVKQHTDCLRTISVVKTRTHEYFTVLDTMRMELGSCTGQPRTNAPYHGRHPCKRLSLGQAAGLSV
eukprot:6187406-Pleurochrysis_carterae.AAC.8